MTKELTTRDGVLKKPGDDTFAWVSMSGTHILVVGTVYEHGVIGWAGSGVGHLQDRGYHSREAAIASGCPCVLYGKPSCNGNE
jgi:hypothetical protein